MRTDFNRVDGACFGAGIADAVKAIAIESIALAIILNDMVRLFVVTFWTDDGIGKHVGTKTLNLGLG